MTDKQILIDGVNVSGCEFYKNTNWKNCYSRDYKESVCQSNHNCLYKKYKRKEQECEELKRENELARQLINWVLKFFELTDYDWKYDQNEISFLIEDCMDDKQSTIDFVNDINQGLFKIIAEIKEIATHCIKQDICTTCDNSDKCHIEDEEIPTYDVCKLILQKIKEVEDE